MCATLPVLAVMGAGAARADVFRIADMIHPIVISQAQCAAIPHTVWVSASGQSVCFRYYVSNAGGTGPIPVVHLSGDKLGKYFRATDSFPEAFQSKDVDSAALQKRADRFSVTSHTTAIYLARVGLDGSSGYHGIRHSLLELQLTNAALTAIKHRHHFVGLNLAGQSGGSTIVGGLLALRSDIRCAVIGAGNLALPNQKGPATRPLDGYSAIDYLPQIVQRSGTRIIVLTDPQDKRVPATNQTPFVEAVVRAGGRIEQYFVPGLDEDHHNMLDYAFDAMAGCTRGAPQQQMEATLRNVIHQLMARHSHQPKSGVPSAMRSSIEVSGDATTSH